MIVKSKISEYLNDSEFVAEVLEAVEKAVNEYEDPADRISYVYHYFADDENKGIVAVFYLGQYPVLSLIESEQK